MQRAQRLPDSSKQSSTTAVASISMESLSSSLPGESGIYRSSRFGYTIDPAQQSGVKTDQGVSNPTKFSGEKGCDSFEKWMTLLINKMGSTSFRDHQSGLTWISIFLTGQSYRLAAARVSNPFHETREPFRTIDELLEHLFSFYGDFDRDIKASHAICSLMQGDDEPFSVFYANYASHSCHLNRPNGAQMDDLYRRLNRRYQMATGDLHDHRTLVALVEHCRVIERDIWRLEHRTALRRMAGIGS